MVTTERTNEQSVDPRASLLVSSDQADFCKKQLSSVDFRSIGQPACNRAGIHKAQVINPGVAGKRGLNENQMAEKERSSKGSRGKNG